MTDLGDDSRLRTARWFRSQSRGAQIAWCDDRMSADEPFSTSAVDVYIPDLGAAAGMNWAFTVNGEPDADVEERAWWDLPGIEPDLIVAAVYQGEDPKFGIPQWQRFVVGRIDDVDGLELPSEVLASVRASDAPRVRLWKACSAEAISRRLAAFTSEVCGRDDISFIFDPSIGLSPVVEQALDNAHRVLSHARFRLEGEPDKILVLDPVRGLVPMASEQAAKDPCGQDPVN